MSLEFIGLIGPQEGSESQTSSGADIDLDFIKAIASAQEYGGFDRVLLAVDSRAADSMILASYISAHTEQLGLLVAHRPGFQAPTFAARQFATLDQLSRGRASINVITGGDNGDLQRDGDFTDKDARYGRTEEYLQILKQTWTAIRPFDHQGPHYHIKNNLTLIKPLQKPHIPIYFSGASDAAVEVAARHADVYMMWGEPLENIRERIAKVRKAAARYGRENHIRFSVSLRPILGATEEAAWARADRILQQAQALHEQRLGAHGQVDTGKSNSGAERMMNIVSQKNVHEEMQKENRSLDGLDFKERNRLAVRFNESKDSAEKMRIFELMQPYDKAMSDHIKRSQALDRKSKRVDALYEQIDVERQKERSY